MLRKSWRGGSRLAGAIGALGLLGGCAVGPNDVPPPAPDVFDASQVLALVQSADAARNLEAAAEARGYRRLDSTPLEALDLELLSFRLPPDRTGAEAIAELEAAAAGSTVGLNHAYATQQGTGGRSLDYADDLLNWPAGGCPAAVPVGLIDTALDPDAPALAGVEIVARSFVADADGPTRHGTEVATVLADPRRLRGATLYSAAVVSGRDGETGRAGVDTLLKALDWLADEGVSLVNVSLAGPYNKLLDQAMAQAQDRGLVVVAAVGNDGRGADPRYPAAFERAIAVTAVDADGRVYRDAVRGAHVDIAAPGVDVRVEAQGARFVTGTSIAAPFVTARLAADPAFAASGVDAARDLLATTARDLGPAGVDETFGAGLLTAEGICGAGKT